MEIMKIKILNMIRKKKKNHQINNNQMIHKIKETVKNKQHKIQLILVYKNLRFSKYQDNILKIKVVLKNYKSNRLKLK